MMQAAAAPLTISLERLLTETERLLGEGEAEGALAQIEQFLAAREAAGAHVAHGEAAAFAAHGEAAAFAAHGKVLAHLRRFEEAHDALAQALRLDPRHNEAHFVLGNLHKQQNALPLAAACFEHVVKADPAHADARYELGWVYQELGRFGDALAQLERAHALAPEDLRIANQLAYMLVRLEHFDRGIALFESLCARTSSAVVRPRINLSNALLRIGRFARGLEVIEEILAVEPNNIEARWNRSHLLLGMGRYAEGWRDYDFRSLLKTRPVRLLPYPEWEGEPLEGKRVIVTAEQGLGDEIMFASCIPEVLVRAREVHIECERRLAALFARSFPGARVWGSDHEAQPAWLREAPEMDYFVRAGTLPRFLRNDVRDFPLHRGYLRAEEARVRHWQEQLGALGPGLKVGLSWRGGTANTRTSMRSMSLAELEPLLRLPGCEFVSLQYGEVRAEIDALRNGQSLRIQHWEEALADYDETAALVSALDLVVSVQTALIHLTGALGKPAWVMVPAAPEWRYGVSGDRMPWYPAIRLFRQEAAGDWQGTLARLASALSAACAGGSVVE